MTTFSSTSHFKHQSVGAFVNSTTVICAIESVINLGPTQTATQLDVPLGDPVMLIM